MMKRLFKKKVFGGGKEETTTTLAASSMPGAGGVASTTVASEHRSTRSSEKEGGGGHRPSEFNIVSYICAFCSSCHVWTDIYIYTTSRVHVCVDGMGECVCALRACSKTGGGRGRRRLL